MGSEKLEYNSLFFETQAPAILAAYGAIAVPHINISYKKIRCDSFFKLLKKIGLVKNTWQIVGIMTNYYEGATIEYILHLILKEFPNVKLSKGNIYTWDNEHDVFFKNSGAVDIYIEFESDADEAEFIIRNGRIMQEIISNFSLVKKL